MDNNYTKKKKANFVLKKLKKAYPDVKIALNYSNALELLIATILSAQCTDVKVNEVTGLLFKKYKKIDDYLNIKSKQFQQDIKQTGFYRQKAKNILATIKQIKDEHNGIVPNTMDELVKLPGVGRKTANVVLGNAFGIPGLPVDTHVLRLSKRIGLTNDDKDAVKVEQILTSLINKKHWTEFSHLLIQHGRNTCKARKPLCNECLLSSICKYFQNNQ